MADDWNETIQKMNAEQSAKSNIKPKDPFLAGGLYWDGYRAGLEAAAKVCGQYGVAARSTQRYFESEGKDEIAATWNGGATACEQLAEDIRALAEKEPTDTSSGTSGS